jgi:hypothetical protein
MAKVLGVSALRNGAFQFAPLMSRSTSAFPRQSPSEPRARRRCRHRTPQVRRGLVAPLGDRAAPGPRHIGPHVCRLYTALRPGGSGNQSATSARNASGTALGAGKPRVRRHRLFAGTFYEDRDAARTLDLLRIRQYLDRRARKSENRRFAGTSKRLMGLEPTTFCMASRRSSQLSYSRARRGSIAATIRW